MIPVYVRHAEEREGRFLGEFAPEALDALVEAFQKYPTWFPTAEEGRFFHAQFVAEEDRVHFEIVLETDDHALAAAALVRAQVRPALM